MAHSDYKRKCENWLTTFCEWVLPRSQAPESVILWCGLFTMASAIRRHISIGKEYLGGWEVNPSMMVLFVAPPGVINKSTTIEFAEVLLDQIPTIARAPDGFTSPVLIQRLEESSDSSISAISSEFGVMMDKGGLQLYTLFTRLFDGARKIDEETIGRGVKFIHKPVFNLLAATTPEWLMDNMPKSVLNGGFGSRIISIFEDSPRQKRLMYKSYLEKANLSPKWFDETEVKLVLDLQHISENIRGNVQISYETEAYLEKWYQELEAKSAGLVKGFIQRMPAHVLKVAMLMHIAGSDSLEITIPDVQKAITIVEHVSHRVKDTYRAVGSNKEVGNLDEIKNFIREKKKVGKQELLIQFESAGLPIKIEELIEALVITGRIELDVDKNSTEPMYKFVRN